MTIKERLKKALSKYNFDGDSADLNAIIAYAYYAGRCSAAKEVCNTAKGIFEEQQKRAEKCRYHEMAKTVQGNVGYIYHSDFDGWIDIFSNDEIDETLE